MITLKKDKHYCHVDSIEKAQKLVNDGYEVRKNSLSGAEIVPVVKKAEPKKKEMSKKK
tara:strand:- start:615 stop:788 length:174 start_codon:yes stop_codon:yes gene_type:complete